MRTEVAATVAGATLKLRHSVQVPQLKPDTNKQINKNKYEKKKLSYWVK